MKRTSRESLKILFTQSSLYKEMQMIHDAPEKTFPLFINEIIMNASR